MIFGCKNVRWGRFSYKAEWEALNGCPARTTNELLVNQ